MSFPVMHSFAGYVVYKSAHPEEKKTNWFLMLYCMFMANMADFDYIPGILIGTAAKFHRGVSHTLGAALMIAGVAVLIAFAFRKKELLKIFVLSFTSYMTHIMLDFWAGTSKLGMRLFWPFTNKVFYSENSLLYSGQSPHHEHAGFGSFISSMFSSDALNRMLYEAVLIFFILSVISLFRQLKQRLAFRATSIVHTVIAFAFLLILSASH